MGLNKQGGIELAPTVLAGSFATDGNSAAVMMLGEFNVIIDYQGSAAGSVSLQRSFDGGANYITCGIDGAGTPATYTGDASLVVNEVEPGVFYRLAASSVVNNTIVYRLSGGQRLT